jgi:Flp pilus assembly protein CpaB
LIILVGIILAIGAFAAILLLGNNGSLGTAVNQPTPTPMTTVVQAVADIPLGTAVTADQVHAVQVAAADVPAEAFTDPSQVIGHVVRRGIATGETLTSSDFASGTTATGDAIVKALKSGLRAMSIEVDQNTGVGTLIQPGDRVDIVIGLKIQQYIPGPNPSALPQAFPPDPQLSVKNIIQNVEVLGALLSTPTTSNTVQGQQQPAPSSAPNGGVGITGQQEIVIVAVTPQQAEVIKYAQVDATDNQDLTISLILRSPADASAPPDTTSGITLYQLIQKYGVLPPIPLLSSPTPR